MSGDARHTDASLSVVFAPLDDHGRAGLVERRLTDAIISGVLRDGERLPSEASMATSLGVALVTAREALEALRSQGLVVTRRGRDGGSFVTCTTDSAARWAQRRLLESSRIDLRDLALHVSAILGTAAEVAADRATDDDLDVLLSIHEGADLRTAGGARRALGWFQLELAAVSQSPRLVREEMRLQSEAAPLLWMCLREDAHRARSAESREEVLAALRRGDPQAARSAVTSFVQESLDWLVAERMRVRNAQPADEEAS
ncbi:transcriptional regulator, GntR family [Quadrisphaera granulorum]|uniref:GntR family transcriptional regulator n=1 Tax=Quadrisphaera granulorum TaxID=317664 RepID=A0A315ZSM9_9ACTN|nr:GntR family transcriptional regulator [Quadrisphaera granulorum]PWJ47734.1 GntR family transcriptional regulator [Quadrisphaera granulorum]SZE98688.1 transcriptional regulator, GntR family [Quadrisphaera granulorum]